MLRALIAGLLAASVAAACSKGKGDAPTVAVGAPAGKVVEVTGKVTAIRDGKPRELAMGAEVFADDQVETSADATVTIELFHNNARWAVVSNKKQRVDASLAWGLDKQAASKTVDHNSAAAGRNAERSAADTSATTGSQPTAAAAESAPMVDEKEDGARSDRAAPPVGQAAPGGAPPPPPPAIEAPKQRERAKGRGESASGGGTATKAKTTESAPQRDSSNQGVERDMAAPREGGKDATSPLSVLLSAKRADFDKCLSPQGRDVSITVTVKNGNATFVLDGSGNRTDKVRSCIEIVVKSIAFPKAMSEKQTISFR